MTHQKKTIKVTNGVAEEGDRVSRPERWESGNLRFNESGAPIFRTDDGVEHQLSDLEEDSDFGYVWSGELMFSFSPTEALEAVEEEVERLKTEAFNDELSNEFFTEFRSRLYAIERRIQQKRKGV